MALTQTQVSQLYVTLFGRVSEGAGNKYWQSAASDLVAGADAMLATAAAQEYFGSAMTSNEAFIKHIYKNTLNKSSVEDPAGIKFWVDALNNGNSRGLVVSELIKAAVNPANAGAAQNYFNNKVALSDYTANTVEGAGLTVADLDPFVNALKLITSDASSIEAGKVYVDTLAGTSSNTGTNWMSTPVNPGAKADLTVNTDKLTANVFNAEMAFNPGGTDRMLTLQSDDVLNGDASRADNTLNVTFGDVNADEGDPTTRTPELNNIQNINLQVTGNINTLDLRYANDVEKVNISKITEEAANTVTVKTIGQKLDGMRLANSAKENVAVSIEHKKGVLAGTEDKSTLFLEDVLAQSLQITGAMGGTPPAPVGQPEGYELLDLVSNKDVEIGTIDAHQLQELTIRGAGSLQIADTEIATSVNPEFLQINAGGISTTGTNGFTKLDASGFAGKLTLDITNIAVNANDPSNSGKPLWTNIIGGGLGDTFYVRSGVATRVAIDGGVGADKLVVVGGAIGDLDAETSKDVSGTIKNIETLELRDQAGIGVIDLDRFDATLNKIVVRDENADTTASTINIVDVSADFLKNGKFVIEHSITDVLGTVNEITLDVELKDASGKDDSVAIEVVNANNTQTTFEYTLDIDGKNAAGVVDAGRVENVSIADNDTESNTVWLTKANEHTGTLTLTGGVKDQYYTVGSTIVSKVIDASAQKSDLRLTVQDQIDAFGKRIGQDIKLGSGNDVLTFAQVDGFENNDSVSDAGGNDKVRAIFSKDNTLNLKGIEELYVAATDNVNLDIAKAEVGKVIIMSDRGVDGPVLADSNNLGVDGLSEMAAGPGVINANIITFKNSKLTELNFFGDVDNDDSTAAAQLVDEDSAATQVFNGVTLDNNSVADLAVNINSQLDTVNTGATAYSVGKLNIHGVKNLSINVSDEIKTATTTTTTTIANIYGKNLNTIVATAKGNLNIGVVTADSTNRGISTVDTTKVGGDFTAHVLGLGDGAEVKLGDGNNNFNALGSAGKLIKISAGKGNDIITGSAQSDYIMAGDGYNTIWADRGDNVVTVGNGFDNVYAKDGNDTVDLGDGVDLYKDNFGTSINAINATNTITKTNGMASVQIDYDGSLVGDLTTKTTTAVAMAQGADVNQVLVVGEGSSLKAQWLGGLLQGNATLLDGAFAMNFNAGTGTINALAATENGDASNNFWINLSGVATTVNGGDGNDVVISLFNAASAALTFNGGNGNDAAVGTDKGDTFTGGAGADKFATNWAADKDGKIVDDAVADTIKIADGDSVADAHDVVYGFTAANDILDLESGHAALAGAEIVTNKAVSGYGKIAKYTSIAANKVTFEDANGVALTISSETLDDALKLLATEFNNTSKAVFFEYDHDNNNLTGNDKSTFVFQDGAQDTVVELVGTTGITALGAAAGATIIAIN
ncbi:DUF4214 domain-containing protein [Campylobacter sp. RM16190]|uniref:DUF4214 domain-containing protein n=1 Tax=Campylobacter sp. RM16190 TaxID=1705727 RepID=UPI001475CE72|nr:DUF4214 domain-containing protein [Campylobacter sp. RM16190]